MNAWWRLTLWLCIVPHGVRADALDIQTGTWEITTRVSQPRRTQVESQCLSERGMINLVQGPDTIEDDPCHPAAPARVGRHAWSIVLNCEDGSQVHARFAVKTPEQFSGTVVRVGGKRALLQKLDLSGRWLRPRCAAKP